MMLQTRERGRYVTGVLALLCVLCACGHAANAAHELHVGIVSDPRSLNPLFDTGQNDIDLGQLTTESLVGLSPGNRIVPLLADPVPSRANGGISADGTTLTYHLRPNARFADGVAVTSKDVAFTYRVILDPRNPVTETEPYRRIAKLETPDARTVRIRLKAPWAAAVTELFAVSDFIDGILPAHAFTSTDVSRSEWNERPFGSGPFRVERWNHGDDIVFVPNPYAWRPPHLRRLIVKILPDQTTLFVALQTGAVDVAALTEDQVAQARALRGVHTIATPQNHTVFLELQTQRVAMGDPIVRRAVIEAIDRDQIRRTVFLGLQPPATTEIPTIFPAHDPGIVQPAYDPQKAAADLDRDGWRPSGGVREKNGRELALLFAYISTSIPARRLATVVQDDLARAGIVLTVKGYPSTMFYGSAAAGGIERGGRFDLAYTDWFGGADPEASEYFTCANRAPSGPNTARWCDPGYDDLYARQQSTLDPGHRRTIFAAMQRAVARGFSSDFLVYSSQYTAYRDGVTGWAPNMLFLYGNSPNWDVHR
jgi:peptide/nickel transport system substrate-binding protein